MAPAAAWCVKERKLASVTKIITTTMNERIHTGAGAILAAQSRTG